MCVPGTINSKRFNQKDKLKADGHDEDHNEHEDNEATKEDTKDSKRSKGWDYLSTSTSVQINQIAFDCHDTHIAVAGKNGYIGKWRLPCEEN